MQKVTTNQTPQSFFISLIVHFYKIIQKPSNHREVYNT
jgi:hypothetical protein